MQIPAVLATTPTDVGVNPVRPPPPGVDKHINVKRVHEMFPRFYGNRVNEALLLPRGKGLRRVVGRSSLMFMQSVRLPCVCATACKVLQRITCKDALEGIMEGAVHGILFSLVGLG